jgi:Ca2+-binding RTX toxin-like protein
MKKIFVATGELPLTDFEQQAGDNSIVATLASSAKGQDPDTPLFANGFPPVISAEHVIGSERDGYIDFIVRLSEVSANNVSVTYSTSSGSASSFSDYTGLSGGLLTFAPGETVKVLRISLENDTSPEASESFYLFLNSPTNAVVGTNVVTATIIDNDGPLGTPIVTVRDVVVDEASGEAVFFIVLDRPSANAVSMNYNTQNGTALAGSDFLSTSGSLVFAAGETVKVVRVSLINDSLQETSEAFNLVLTNIANATNQTATGSAQIAASDALNVGVPTINAESVLGSEREGYIDFVVRLSNPSANNVSVTYSTSSGSASSFSDYTGLSGGLLTFAPGETVKVLRISLENDTSPEASESFYLFLNSPTNAVVGTNVVTATIIDNDGPLGTPIVTVRDVVVDEASGEAVFFIVLDRPSANAVSMNYNTQNGTALAGSDFLSTSGSLVFAAGETVKVVRVSLINDSLQETSEAFNLVISSVVNADAAPIATANIGANDAVNVAQPVIQLANVTAEEASGYLEFVIRLSNPSVNNVSVIYSTSSGSASSFSDYTGLSGGLLTFAPGETLKTLRISIEGDNTIEGNETFNLLLSNATNAVIGNSTATGTITDTQFTGSLGNDILTGTSVSDILIGLAGDDVLMGGASGDTINGGDGSDTASYATSNIGVYVVFGDFGAATGDAVGDNLISIENLTGSSFNDILGVDNGDNRLSGRAGNDRLLGLGGNDVLDGGDGGDSLEGGSGTDTASYATAASGVYMILGDGAAWTGDARGDILSSIENVTGSRFADVLGLDDNANVVDGGAGNDQLLGFGGNDILIGGAGRDILNGGNGTDTVSYASAASGVYAFFGDWGGFTGDAQGDTFFSIENITGSAFNDILGMDGGNNVLDGGAGDDVLYGNGGADTLIGGAGFDTANYATATSRIYVFFGDAGAWTGDAQGDSMFSIEAITGTNFNDIIGMDDFANTLAGGAGDDILYGEGGGDRLFGNAGFDTVSYAFAPSGVYILFADLGNATGDAAGDSEFSSIESIVGSAFDDIIGMGDFNDTLAGGGGNDVLLGNGGGDKFFGNDGFDTVSYALAGSGVYVFFADLGNATGDAAGDSEFSSIESIVGSNFNDIIGMGDFSDTIFGGAGNDILLGMGGNDTLWGGAGNDFFAYTNTGFGADTIRDFQDGLDRIDFSRVAGVNFASLAISSVAGGVQVGLGASSILIAGASISQITAADFLFA